MFPGKEKKIIPTNLESIRFSLFTEGENVSFADFSITLANDGGGSGGGGGGGGGGCCCCCCCCCGAGSSTLLELD